MSAMKLNAVWGFTCTLSQFSYMAMFINGFWFGPSLVYKGTISAGDVMFVFWACSVATSNLQLCISQLIILAKGKFAMAALMIEPPPHRQLHQHPRSESRPRRFQLTRI